MTAPTTKKKTTKPKSERPHVQLYASNAHGPPGAAGMSPLRKANIGHRRFEDFERESEEVDAIDGDEYLDDLARQVARGFLEVDAD